MNFTQLIPYIFSADSASNCLPRIVGGQRARIEDYKWQAALFMDSIFLCGGRIVSPTKILTAAHCVSYQPYHDKLHARVGSTSPFRGGVRKSIVSVHLHPDYNRPTNANNDIAVVFLGKPLIFDATIGPIPLAGSELLSLTPGDLVTVSGFGAKSIFCKKRDHFHAVSVPVVDHDLCVDSYKRYNGVEKLTKNMICAGYYEVGGKDACIGDSGGK